MDEELTDKLQDTLIGLIDSATNAAEFVQTEIPHVLEQLLTWKLVEGIVLLSFGLLLIVPTLLIIKPTIKGWNHKYDSSEADAFWAILGAVAIVSGAIGSLILVCTNLINVLQIWLAPKVYLIEYAATLAK